MNEESKVLYIITGVPGSGKYTLGTALCLQEMVEDMYYENAFEQANKPEDTFERATASMALGRNIALCTEFDPTRYIDIAKQFKYQIIEVVMKSTFQEDTGTEEKVTPAEMNKAKYALQERLSADWALL